MASVTEEENPIRVVDRRMFTAEGDLRPGFEAEDRPEAAPAAPAPPAPPAATAPVRESAPRGPAPEDTGEMLEIIRSLAATAYAALGIAPDSAEARRPEPAVARQMIDWLAALEQKTRGNLSLEESGLLGQVLYELRLAFMEVMGPSGPEPPKR